MGAIFKTAFAQAVAHACAEIDAGNNGWADIGANSSVADGVRAAGYVVIEARNVWGNPTFKGYTRRAQESMRAEWAANGAAGYAVSTYKAPSQRVEGPDYEGAILARQERFMEGM